MFSLLVENYNGDNKSQNMASSQIININVIFEKIAPYLEKPEVIKQFLELHSDLTRSKMIEEIEKEIKKSETIIQTDFRILLNSLEAIP